MALGLLDMPEDVMTKIMEDIGIKAIMTLRKVCHDLRNFIDDVKPDVNLKHIKIDWYWKNSISVKYTFCEEKHCHWYQKHDEGCLLENDEGKKILLKNENFMTIGMKDIETVLRHQKSHLKKFFVSGKKKVSVSENLTFKEYFERILKSGVHPLKVEYFKARFYDQNLIIAILPFLESKTLKKVKITNYDDDLNIDQLVILDQWKNIQHIEFNCPFDIKYIQHFTHFSNDYFCFKSTYFPNLLWLKDMYLQSTGFQKIQIDITEEFDMDDALRSTELFLGPSDFDRMRWFYRIPDTYKVLEICVYTNARPVFIALLRKDENSVPQDAIIQN